MCFPLKFRAVSAVVCRGPGAHVFGVEQRQLERMAMGSMCSHQDTDTLANVTWQQDLSAVDVT
jgi:hypothetical protein